MSNNQESNDTNSGTPKSWHYAAFGGAPQGPVTETQLNSLHKTGKINDATLIWREGQPEWLAYSSIFQNLLPPVPGAPVVHGHSTLATLDARLGAHILDQLLAVLSILPGALFLITPDGVESDYESLEKAIWVMLIGYIIYISIQATRITSDGQSIGKFALDIKIVGFPNEENPGFVRAFLLRSFIPHLLGLIPLWGTIPLLIDVLFIFSPSRRCLHDIVAGTKVVKVDK